MARFEPGVRCITRGMKVPSSNGKIVELVRLIHPPIPTKYYPWWHCKTECPMMTEYPNPKMVPPGTNVGIPQACLVPITGPDLGITEDDVKELYEPEGLSSPVPANLERVC